MRKIVWIAALASLLAACGGGGGDGPAPPAGVTFNMDAAYTRMLSQGQTFGGLRAESQGVVFDLTVRFVPMPDGTFDGVVYKRSDIKVLMSASVLPTPLDASVTMYYSVSPLRLAGETEPDGFVTKFVPTGNLPASGSPGQSGPYARVLLYEPGATAPLAEGDVTWSIEPDTATTAWACFTTGIAGSTTYDEKECYRIDQAGNVLATTLSLDVDGRVVTFR